MTTQTNDKLSKPVKFVFGSAVGILAGWMLNKYGKGKVKQLYSGMRYNIHETLNQWYEDGEKRAIDLKNIKHEIDSDS